MEKIDRSFLGTGWGFPPTFRREGGGVDMLTGTKDIESSMEIILCTLTGERVMLPNFGCNLRPYIFEPLNIANITLIKKIVFEALAYHEPRIIVDPLIERVIQEEGVLEITIPYTVIKTNTRYNYVFPFYYSELTNVKI